MKRIVLAVCLILFALTLTACRDEQNAGNDQSGGSSSGAVAKEGYIYSPGSDLWIVYPENIDGEALHKLVLPIDYAREELSMMANSSSEKHHNEIIIGQSDRSVSQKAYTYLKRQNKDDSRRLGYIVYSDGASVALAYDEDVFETNAALNVVIDKFVSEYISGAELKVKPGVLIDGTFDLVEYQRAND